MPVAELSGRARRPPQWLQGIRVTQGTIWNTAYLVLADRLLVVDTVCAPDVETGLMPYILEQNRGRDGPLQVVNTHCHCDHIGGNAALRHDVGAVVAVHELDAPDVASHQHQFDRLFRPLVAAGVAGIQVEEFIRLSGPDAPVDTLLHDGDVIDLGQLTFSVIHLPGHTAGSVGLIEQRSGVLLVGDSVQAYGTESTKVPMIEDVAAYRASLLRLLDLQPSLLLTSHPFLPSNRATYTGGHIANFLRASLSAVDQFTEVVDGVVRHAERPLSCLDVCEQMVSRGVVAQVDVYLAITVGACLRQLASVGLAAPVSEPVSILTEWVHSHGT